jgi:uncharacterized protein DUF4129
MKDKSTRLLFIAGAGAELTWLYAWACFLLVNCFNRLYPLPETIGTFFLAAFLTRFPRGRGWRVIQIIGLQLIGFICCALWVVHAFYYQTAPFWSRIWLMEFFRLSRGHLEWFLLFFVFGYTVTFWITGVRFVLRKRSYDLACSRFDRGVAAFFLLFLIKLIINTQMAVAFKDSMTLVYIFPFFLFGLTEIGLARDQGNGHKKYYLTGYRAIGVFPGFALSILILGAGLFFLFLPYLTAASTVGYALIKSAARPLAPFLIALIRFFFGYAKNGPAADPVLSSTSNGLGDAMVGETSGWLLWLEKFFIWVGARLLLLLGAIGVCIGIWYGIRWLFSKRAVDADVRIQWRLSILCRLRAFLYAIYGWLVHKKRERKAGRYYAALLRWGRLSGLPHEPSETPMEYGFRLADHFPKLRPEIWVIIEMFQCEIYGERPLSRQEFVTIQYAWQKLRTPLLWPFRFKSFFRSA